MCLSSRSSRVEVEVEERNLQIRLPVLVIGVSAAFLALAGVSSVRQISALTRDRVHTAALDLVTLRAQEIVSFFEERARVVDTVFASPALVDWFARYDTFRRPLEHDLEYQRSVQGFFRSVADSDPSIVSVFFSTAATGEYFREVGRIEREGYDPTQRWWWREALEQDRLYVTSPGVDANTGNIAVTVQKTIYLPDGRFLGVGGVDLLLNTLGTLVEDIEHESPGRAFLANQNGQLIYFPDLPIGELRVGDQLTTPIASVDRLFADTQGFASLSARLSDREQGFDPVRWRGEDLVVVHSPVRSDHPSLQWTLGLMVPESRITSVIARSRNLTALAVVLATAFIAGLTLFATSRVTLQLREAERRRADALADANVRLREADRMKSQFLATMSHELRTPLNSIIGFSEVLRGRLAGDIEPRFLRFLDNIHSSGEHLLTMISDILDLSKVAAGKMELNPEPLLLPPTLHGICDIVQGTARERDVSLELDVPADLSTLEADPVRFKQILFNLLSNAVKFSPRGGLVQLAARQLPAGGSPLGVRSIRITVTDQGAGIPEEQREAVFEEFRQLETADGLPPPGTGLGLALVRRLVELHGGRVEIVDSPGSGSTFAVTLPLARTSS